MALHTDLPIYKHAYGLLRLSLVGKRHMPRDFKALRIPVLKEA